MIDCMLISHGNLTMKALDYVLINYRFYGRLIIDSPLLFRMQA